MKTYIRLFFSGAIGGIIGGSSIHHILSSNILGMFWTTLLGIMLGGFMTSFVYDWKGTLQVCKHSFRTALPLAGRLVAYCINGFVSFLLRITPPIGAFLSKVAVHIIALALSVCTWLFTLSGFANIWYSEVTYGPKVTVIALSLVLPLFITITAQAVYQMKMGRGEEDLLDLSLKENILLAVSGFCSANLFSVCFYIARDIVMSLSRVDTITRSITETIFGAIRFVTYLILLITTGLTACRKRSAAMAGACIGTLAGLITGNPLILGLVGGIVAVLAHAISVMFRETLETWAARLKPEMTLVQDDFKDV